MVAQQTLLQLMKNASYSISEQTKQILFMKYFQNKKTLLMGEQELS